METKFDQAYHDEWIYIEKGTLYIACCDCGLVHDVYVKKVGKRTFIKFLRDDARTEEIRKTDKTFVCLPVDPPPVAKEEN